MSMLICCSLALQRCIKARAIRDEVRQLLAEQHSDDPPVKLGGEQHLHFDPSLSTDRFLIVVFRLCRILIIIALFTINLLFHFIFTNIYDVPLF